jgi:class 3 adenylate cyclase
MRCTKCGIENAADAKFCNQCATPLSRACPKCAHLNASDAKFCAECAEALTSDVSKSTARTPSTSPVRVASEQTDSDVVEGERKTVTALFADIKGSTELAQDLDPEEARAIIDPALKLMIAAVGRYDGYVVQSTGDGIFAMFGVPSLTRTILNARCMRRCGCRKTSGATRRRYAAALRGGATRRRFVSGASRRSRSASA